MQKSELLIIKGGLNIIFYLMNFQPEMDYLSQMPGQTLLFF